MPPHTPPHTQACRRPISPSTRQRRTPRAARSCRRTPHALALPPRTRAFSHSRDQASNPHRPARTQDRVRESHSRTPQPGRGCPGQRTAHRAPRTAHEPEPKHEPETEAPIVSCGHGAGPLREPAPDRRGTGSNTHKSTRQPHQKRSHQGRTSKLAPNGCRPSCLRWHPLLRALVTSSELRSQFVRVVEPESVGELFWGHELESSLTELKYAQPKPST